MNDVRSTERDVGSIPKGHGKPRALTAEEIRFDVSLGSDFQSTRDFIEEEGFAGQERGLGALELGLGVTGNGYNIFVTGLTGAEKLKTLCEWLDDRVSGSSPSNDWVYVHNFHSPDEPAVFCLRAGFGVLLKDKMNGLVKALKEELPKAFRKENFAKERALLREKFTQQAQEASESSKSWRAKKDFWCRQNETATSTLSL